MKLESLSRLIESADDQAFREIARICLAARGLAPSLTDGPNDGGGDFALYLNVGAVEPAPIAVQVSVEKNWKSKIRKDAIKIKSNLKITDMLYISSRRLPDAEFIGIQDELRQTQGIRVQKMDSQSIASLTLNRALIPQVLQAMGISLPAPSSGPRLRHDLRKDVAYAFAFFGADAQSFRVAALERAVLAIMSQNGGEALRTNIVEEVAITLGLAPNQRRQIDSAVDRMLQDGRVRAKNGSLRLEQKEADTWRGVNALQRKSQDNLRAVLDKVLLRYVTAETSRKRAVDLVLEDLGALLFESAAATSSSLEQRRDQADRQGPVQHRLRHLQETLAVFGVPEAERNATLSELSQLAAESDFGKTLLAGEIFLHLLNMRTPHLLAALGSRSRMEVIVDTSVAMPLLCVLLFEPIQHDFFLAAKHVYDQLIAHEIQITLPRQYLEETAAHLIEAYRYGDIVGTDPDLRASTNAFVAHYATMNGKPDVASFVKYLKAFGFNEAQAKGDFYAVRDVLMRRLEEHFRRYNIRCGTFEARRTSLKSAEEHLAYAQRMNPEIRRARTTLDHDAEVVGWLYDHEIEHDVIRVLCTWDNLHSYLRQDSVNWEVLDPAVFGDVLSLAAPETEDLRLVSPVVVAITFSNTHAQRGAEVWDFLIRTEREKLNDAALREQAQAFKGDWLSRAARDSRSRNIQRAWEEWKAAHLRVMKSETTTKANNDSTPPNTATTGAPNPIPDAPREENPKD